MMTADEPAMEACCYVNAKFLRSVQPALLIYKSTHRTVARIVPAPLMLGAQQSTRMTTKLDKESRARLDRFLELAAKAVPIAKAMAGKLA